MRAFIKSSNLRHFSKATKAQIEKQALYEMIEESPYKFMNFKEPSNFKELKKFNNKAFNETFRMIYQHFLQVLASPDDSTLLQQMCLPQLYTDLQDFRSDILDLNDAELRVENVDTNQFDIYASEITFVAGRHIDESKNQKELISKYNDEYRGNYSD